MTISDIHSPARARELFDRALAHHLAGDVSAAIAGYRDTLAADPMLAEGLNNLGALLAPSGAHDEAVALFRRAIAANPDYADAHNNLGLTLAQRGRHAEAATHFVAALEREPSRAAWWNNLGNAHVECFRFAEALNAYDRAIRLDDRNPDAWSNRGLALRGLRRPDDAIASFERALDVDPRAVNALVNLGVVLKEQRRPTDAIAIFERARQLRPSDPGLLCNYAAVYESQGDYERMRELADIAASIDASFAESHVLRGNYHMERGELDAAEAAYQRARSLDAENRNANWNLALIWLMRGDFRRGWAQFEWRKRLQSVLLDHHEYPGAPWAGDDLGGRRILLYAEQGLGDAIQFVRYAAELKTRGASAVIVEAPAAVTGLLASAPGVDDVVARGNPLPSFDVHASLMDLPRLCGTELDTIPGSVPYLDAPRRPVSALIEGAGDGLKVGVVWAGNPMHQRDHLRSVPLAEMAALIDVPGTRWFSLQKGGPERELVALGGRIEDLSPHLADFRDTAAAIAALDLVITVDTSVAHLAAALGRETWILITRVPDFRWMLDRSDSPWYPSVRLFRQPAPRDWTSVVANVRRALGERACSTATPTAGAGDAVTMLSSAARRPDGRPWFELTIAIPDLAEPAVFAAYERELLGAGAEPALSMFFAEAMRDGDVLLDPAPGLGLAALGAVTSSRRSVSAHVVEPDAARTTNLRRAARDAGASQRLALHPSLPAAKAACVERAEAGARVFVRLGDTDRTPELLDALAADGALDMAAIAWPATSPAGITGALDVLAAHGFWLGVASIVDGELTVDPLHSTSEHVTIVALDPALLRALGAEPASSVGWAGATGAARDERAGAGGWLAFDWEVRGDTGWGLYGMHLATQLAMRGSPAPIVLACDAPSLSPLARHRLQGVLDASAPAAQALADPAAIVTVDGPVLRAFGNGFVGAGHTVRLHGTSDIGVVFFEDTHLSLDALERASHLDAIIAGSTWNADVLRAYGLERVHTVIQGIDPTVFHPAPKSGMFGDRFVIFTGGKLEYRKGQDIVVAAFRRLLETHPDALLVTAWHNHWPQLIADLELAGHVRGVPRVEHGRLQIEAWLASNGVPRGSVVDVGCIPNAAMGPIVREADVALFPNRCEGGTNLVAMECMAAGVPTIVSANTGHRDLLETGGCFALRRQGSVPAPTRYFTGTDGWGESDVDEIVAILQRLCDDRALAAERAATGVAAMQRLTWGGQVAALLDVIGIAPSAVAHPATA